MRRRGLEREHPHGTARHVRAKPLGQNLFTSAGATGSQRRFVHQGLGQPSARSAKTTASASPTVR